VGSLPTYMHNFNFTSELKFALIHDAAVTTTIGVQGDDESSLGSRPRSSSKLRASSRL
jgi:hypothetical protein